MSGPMQPSGLPGRKTAMGPPQPHNDPSRDAALPRRPDYRPAVIRVKDAFGTALAAALIGLMRAGQKPARSASKRTGCRPLSNPPLRLIGADPPQLACLMMTLKRQESASIHCQRFVDSGISEPRPGTFPSLAVPYKASS